MDLPDVRAGSEGARIEAGIQTHCRRKTLGPLNKISKKNNYIDI